MKHFYFYVLLFLIAPAAAFGQESFIHINTKNIDSTAVTFYGDSLNAAIAAGFSDNETMINYNPVMSFDGISDYMEWVRPVSDLAQLTVFTVFKAETDSITEADVWGIHGEETTLGLTTKRVYSSSKQAFYSGLQPGKAILHTFLQLHRSQQTLPNSKTFVGLGATQKNSPNPYFKGSIAEIIAFKKRLRGSKRQKIESALAIKYGITLTNGENYISSDKKVIWDTENNAAYSNNIAGIARDDASQVYQKQAASSNNPGFLVISAEALAPSNAENISTLSDQNFLLWGDNAGQLISEPETETTERAPMLQRKWLVHATGGNTQSIKTEIRINANTLFEELKDRDDYLLIIDRSGEGDFLLENTEYIQAESLTNEGILTFTNIFWDTDLSGTDVFSIALSKTLRVLLTADQEILCPNGLTVLNYKAKGGFAPYNYSLEDNAAINKQWDSSMDAEQENTLQNIGKGDYTLVVTDNLGNTAEASYNINEEEAVSVDLGTDKTLQFEQELILQAQISHPEKIASYLWTNENGFSSTEESISATDSGIYTLTATTYSGCEYSDSITVKESFIKEIILYPNPTDNGKYRVDIELADRVDINVRVYNLSGINLENFSVKNKRKTTIKGGPIQTVGIYQIVIETPYETVGKLLIVD